MNLKLMALAVLSTFVFYSQAFAGFTEAQLAYEIGDYARVKVLANQGNAVAQRYMGGICAGDDSIPNKWNTAFKWFQKASKQGDKESQEKVAMMYMNGWGVKQNTAEGLRLYFKLMEKDKEGLPGMQWELGEYYNNGTSVQKNIPEAIKWYLKSVEGGCSSAAYALGSLYKKGEGVAQDIPKAIKWYQTGVEMGNGTCASALAEMYEKGDGVILDTKEEEKYSKKSDELNSAQRAKWAAEKEPLTAAVKAYRQVKVNEEQKKFRAKLKLGDDTHCGMVVAVNRPVIQIQTMIGEKWFKIGQLYTPGAAECKFSNGEYVEP